MKGFIFYLLLTAVSLNFYCQPPDTLKQKVKVVHLDTSGVTLYNPFALKPDTVKKVDGYKKLEVVWKKKYNLHVPLVFQVNGLIFTAQPKYNEPVVLDPKTGEKIDLGSKRWQEIFADDHSKYICYEDTNGNYILADFITNRKIKKISDISPKDNFPFERDDIFFPEDILLYLEKTNPPGKETEYKILKAYSIKYDSILWSKDEVHAIVLGYKDGDFITEMLGEYNVIKDWREKGDYLIMEAGFPGSPRRLYFFDKYSFTIKKAYPIKKGYHYKFMGDTLYWYVYGKEVKGYDRMYAVDYINDRIYWGIYRGGTVDPQMRDGYFIFSDSPKREEGVFWADIKTGKPLKRIVAFEDYTLVGRDHYVNGNIFSTVIKHYWPEETRYIKGNYDVVIDVEHLELYKLESISEEMCKECIQPERPLDCVNKLRFLNIKYKDYIYAELRCKDFYYLLCLKLTDIEVPNYNPYKNIEYKFDPVHY